MSRVPQLGVVLAVVVLAVGADFVRMRALDHALATTSYEDVYYVPPAEWLPVLSLGYHEALADLLWCRSLVYFGEEVVHRGKVAHVFDYVDAILRLDPKFRKVYVWAGTAGIYRPVEATEADIRRSAAYLETAARIFPDDGQIAWDAGATLEFELAPYVKDVAERDEIRTRAVRYMQTAARLGAGPAWLALTNVTALRRLGQNDQALRHLEEMYATVSHPSTKAEIGRQIESLRSATYREALERETELTEARRRRDYPYVDAGLHLLLGTRPVLPMDALAAKRFLD